MDSVRLGIVGVGNMGSSHARYLLRGDVSRCEVTAVCDIDEAQLDKFRTDDPAKRGKLKELSPAQQATLKDISV